ncbi:MAG: sugar ABC transporter substrate-binding protein, partial [Mesorhizobium sp.]
MKWIVIGAALAAAAAAFPARADTPLVGIVSISATEANNARYIVGAKAAAKEIGW